MKYVYIYIYIFIYLSFFFFFFLKKNIFIFSKDLAMQMLFSMKFQYDSLKNNENEINLKIKPLLNVQRRLWYCTYILKVFSLLNSNIPITSFIDSYLVPFPDDDEIFNEEITTSTNYYNAMKNDYINRNSVSNTNYEFDTNNMSMPSNFSFYNNMNKGNLKQTLKKKKKKKKKKK